MGKNFCPPKKADKAQWTKLQLMVDAYQAGLHHQGCYFALYRWGFCTCRDPRIKVKKLYKTEGDVKRLYGLRRSQRKHRAREEDRFRGTRLLRSSSVM